ncbi:Type 1 glutamine amidotransferase-like domain-containing protein [Sporolactobacillus sp. STCC-11]|uniref:Type 1 glutamine amidotransferase-like domain-containing protein n=1 Tax=Sporolactobacillus caesalpiniae TaxID=3230362 RepID=UPI0033919064
MGKLLLSGGGDAKQSSEINAFFASINNKAKPLLYIPLAGDPEYRSYESCLNYVKKVFNPLGIDRITMWTELDNKTFEQLLNFSAVYLSGGLTVKLLSHFGVHFRRILKEYFVNGGIIYGQSAGAIVLGKTINVLDQAENDIDGLNLVSDYSLSCHYQKEHNSLISRYVQRNNQKVIALPEGTALYQTREEMFQIVGDDPAFVFDQNGKQELSHVAK